MKYRTIVADPPWDVKRPTGWNTTRNHQSQPYPTMTVEEIASLPVVNLAADVSYLFLWTVNAYIESAYEVVRAWGFRPVSMLVWCKDPCGIGPGGLFATTTEYVLYGRRGSTPQGRRKSINSTWFNWPRAGQSEKPEAFLDLVEANLPGPYLELFARRNRLGWHTWGNEAFNQVEVGA